MTKLSHIIEFVADMDRAVAFYRDVIGLPLKFQSPEWNEFATGETTFALHPASDKNAAGKIELGLSVSFHTEMQGKGVRFPMDRTFPSKKGALCLSRCTSTKSAGLALRRRIGGMTDLTPKKGLVCLFQRVPCAAALADLRQVVVAGQLSQMRFDRVAVRSC